MKDVSVIIHEYKFNFRVCGLIENKGRYLLQRSKYTDFLNMPGGRVHVGENTQSAIMRELKEELQLENIDLKLLKISEQFFQFAEKKYHELDFIYYTYLSDDHELTQKDVVVNIDNSGEEMIWVDRKDLGKYKILPELIYTITNDNQISHLIQDKLHHYNVKD